MRFTANEIAEVEEKFNGVSYVEDERQTEPKLDAAGLPVLDEDGDPVRVYTAEVKQVLRTYNGMEGFQQSGTHKPLQTMRNAMAIVLGRPERAVGAALIPEEIPTYISAVAGAFGIATGQPAESVGKALEEQRIEQKKARAALLAKVKEETDSTGTDGSDSGPAAKQRTASAGASKSSGD